jgi:hypothetical protein
MPTNPNEIRPWWQSAEEPDSVQSLIDSYNVEIERQKNQQEVNKNYPDLVAAYPNARSTIKSMRDEGVHNIETIAGIAEQEENDKEQSAFDKIWNTDESIQKWKQALGNPNKQPSELDKYDYKAAIKEGARPTFDPESAEWHWPSRYKADDHPNRFITKDGKKYDTKNEQYVLEWWDAVKDLKKAEWVPYLGGTLAAVEMADIYAKYKKLEDGTADENDLKVLKEYIDYASADRDMAYNIISIVSNLPGFVGEIWTTGPFYAGGKIAAKEAAKKFLKKAISKKGQTMLKKAMKKKGLAVGVEIAEKGVGVLGGAAYQFIPATAPRIAAEYYRRVLPQFDISEDEQGDLSGIILGEGDDVIPALAKAFGTNFIEIASERTGGLLNYATRSAFVKAFLKKNPTATTKKTKELLNRMGWNGVLGEMFEERVGEAARAVTGIDEYEFPDKEQFLTEFIAFSLGGVGLQQTAKGVAKVYEGEPVKAEGTKIQEELDRAYEAGEIDRESYKLTSYLASQDPDIDEKTALNISNELKIATKEYIKKTKNMTLEEFYKDQGIEFEKDEEGDVILTGATQVEKDIGKNLISLWRGADSNTIVEEWYHAHWNRMTPEERAAFEEYHKQSEDKRSVEEHFGKEGADFFFNNRMNEQAYTGLRDLYTKLKDAFMRMVGKAQNVDQSNIPEDIAKMYGEVGKAEGVAEEGEVQFQAKKNPKIEKEGRKLFTSWDPLTDKQVSKSKAMQVFQKLQKSAELGNHPFDKGYVIVGNLGMVDLRDEKDGSVELGAIASFDKGTGKGTQLLQMTLKAADDVGVKLTGAVKQIGIKGLNDEQLLEWYRRQGFETEDKGDIWHITHTPPSLKQKPSKITLSGKFQETELDLKEEAESNLTLADFREIFTDNISTDYYHDESKLVINHRSDVGEWEVFDQETGSSETTYSEEEALESVNALIEDKAFEEKLTQFQAKKKSELDKDVKPRSKEFKSWFKDSKVVDDDGEPLVVYHGAKSSFDEFFLGKKQKEHFGDAYWEYGQYFTPDPNVAGHFALTKGFKVISNKTGKDISTPQTYPVYLNIKKPLIIDSEEEGHILTGRDRERAIRRATRFPSLYDGVILKGHSEPAKKVSKEGEISETKDTSGVIYIVFEPNQIKGQFNPKPTKEDPRIMFQAKKLTDVQDKVYKILPPPVAAPDQLRKKLGRKPKVGKPRNRKRVFENDDVYIVVGKKTPEDWVKQVEKVLKPKDIKEAAAWYEKIKGAFIDEFKDEAEGLKYMTAWLLGQQQATPAESLANVLRAAEQEATKRTGKKAGLADENIKKVLKEESLERGVGPKLFDFVDSALGSPTRNFLGHKAEGGSPFVVDRHSYRDAGYVDPPFLNFIEKIFGPKRAKTIKKDGNEAGAVSSPQYERASEWGNNLTNSLNEQSWQGRNDWTPAEVQAVGWIAMETMIGQVEDVSVAFEQNTFKIAHELVFGEGSQYAEQFPDLNKLNDEQALRVTDKVLKKVTDIAREVTGVRIRNRGAGFGGWQDGINPNYVTEIITTPKGAERFMNVLGYLSQQTEVFATKTKYSGRQLGIDFVSDSFKDDKAAASFYTAMRGNHSDQVDGYYKVDTQFGPAIRMIFDVTVPNSVLVKNIKKRIMPKYDELQDIFDETIKSYSSANNIVVSSAPINVISQSYGNDYQKNTRGEAYIRWINESLGSKVQRRLDDIHRPELEDLIQESISQELQEEVTPTQFQAKKATDVAKKKFGKSILSKYNKKNKSLELKDATLWQWFVHQIQDNTVRLRLLTESLMTVGNVKDEDDLYLLTTLMTGKAGHRIDKFNEKIYIGKKSLLQRIVKYGFDLDEFGKYMMAQHAAERNKHIHDKGGPKDGGSGMSNQQADEVLNSYKGQKKKKMEAYSREFREKVLKADLKNRLASGLLSEDDYDLLANRWDYYVPLKVDRGEKGVRSIKASIGGKGYDVRGKEYFGIRKGHKGDPTINPVFSGIVQHQEGVVRAEKNVVAKAMLRLTEKHKSAAWSVRGQKAPPRYDKNGEIVYYQYEKLEDNEMLAKVDGKSKVITIHDTYMANALKNIDKKHAVPIIRNVMNYLRLVVTTMNPEFFISNFQRDIQTALINISGEQGAKIAAQTVKNLPKSWKGIWIDVISKKDSEWARLYDELKATGGKVGWFNIGDIEEQRAEIQAQLSRLSKGKGNPKNVAKRIMDWANNLNEVVESGTRLAAYKAAKDSGMSKERAAFLAKEITVNFNRTGAIGGWINSAYLFWNATIQGAFRVSMSIGRSKTTRALAAGVAANGAYQAWLARSMCRETWETLPEWEKDNNHIFLGPDCKVYYKMRVPFGYNVFHVMGSTAMDMAMDHQQDGIPLDKIDYGKGVARFFGAIGDAANPFGAGSRLTQYIPTVARPFWEMANNVKWNGAPIYPEEFFKEIPDSKKHFKGVSPTAKAVTDWISKVTGGKEMPYEGVYHPGVFELSPETLEHLTDFIGGGTGKFIKRLIDTGSIIVKEGKVEESRKVPFLRLFKAEVPLRAEKSWVYKHLKISLMEEFHASVQLRYLAYVGILVESGEITEKEGKRITTLFRNNQAKIGGYYTEPPKKRRRRKKKNR